MTKNKCPICGKKDYLERYYDRHDIYSGRACSKKCSRELPGQGDMYYYDDDIDEDDYSFSLEGENYDD